MDKNAEQHLEKVKNNVQQKFNEVRAALHMREKLLLRQLEVIANTQQQQQMLKTGRADETINNGNDVGDTNSQDQSGDVRFVTGDEEQLLAAIRNFGRFQLDNMQLALQDVLRNEDYIAPLDDHETMYKCLEQDKIAYCELDEQQQPEAIVVDFSRNKGLMETSAKLLNKSIINITLQEAKELIRKAKLKRETHIPPLNLEELNDELESSIADAVSSLSRGETSKSTCLEQKAVPPSASKPKTRKPRFKPKITINNCNGTINLRNIASLTINCSNEETVSAEIPLEATTKLQQSADTSTTSEQSTPSTTASSSNYSSNASSRSQSKKQKGSKKLVGNKKDASKCAVASSSSVETTAQSTQPSTTNSCRYEDVNVVEQDTRDVTCDFYNRLLNEIKKSLHEKPVRAYDIAPTETVASSVLHAADSNCDANLNTTYSTDNAQVSTSQSNADVSTHSSQIQPGKRLILKNFENLKIILEANSGDEDAFHPVQIEQWLAEIISETDLEPMQNTDILEHSKIHNSESI